MFQCSRNNILKIPKIIFWSKIYDFLIFFSNFAFIYDHKRPYHKKLGKVGNRSKFGFESRWVGKIFGEIFVK